MTWEFRGHPIEVFIYFSVYFIYLIYGLIILITSRQQILDISKFGFTTGWSWFGYPKDNTNYHLRMFTQYIADNWHWYLLHIALNTLGKSYGYLKGKRNVLYAVFGAVYICFTTNLLSIILFSLLVMSFYVISDYQSKRLVWLLATIWMAVMQMMRDLLYLYVLDYTECVILMQLLTWTVLRSCSFALQRISANTKTTGTCGNGIIYTFDLYLGYILYFPCLIYGPFMGYDRYKVIERQNHKNCNNWKLLVWEIFRALIWWLFLQITSHYLYISYMARDIRALEIVDTTYDLYAIAYLLGQYFYLFYVISYSLGLALARYDGLSPTNKPRCIGRIHFCSDMWKYFDEGLYEFLFRHIYCELCSIKSSTMRKLFATTVTFGVVFVWHGCYLFVFIWSILNFCCLVAEKFFKYFIRSDLYTNFVRNVLKLQNNGIQRFNALLATQIFIPAAFSHVFFVGGQDVGEYLIRGAYQNGWFNYILLTLVTYCMFQCSQILLQLLLWIHIHISIIPITTLNNLNF